MKEIDTKEISELMRKAITEITQLRRRNEVLEAKVEVMDLFALTLKTEPRYGCHGASIDVAWEMQQKVDEIKDADKKKAESSYSSCC